MSPVINEALVAKETEATRAWRRWASAPVTPPMPHANGSRISTAPSSHSANTFGFPGATPTISANGSQAGIVWVLENAAFRTKKPAILHAYDANDVLHELYNSQQAGSRDTLPLGVGFAVPTVANGKVYVGTVSELDVFGVMP